MEKSQTLKELGIKRCICCKEMLEGGYIVFAAKTECLKKGKTRLAIILLKEWGGKIDRKKSE